MKRSLIILGIALLFIGATVYQRVIADKDKAALPAGVAPQLNHLAPSFELEGLDGKTYTVGGKRDKPVFVNFWASWCEPCQAEAPDLKAIYDKYKEKFDLYGVNVTSQDTVSGAEAMVKKYDFKFPVLLDPEGSARSLYELRGIPTSFMIDKDGKIVDIVNIMEPRQLEQKILDLING